jgi:hypothetical protein
VIATAAPQPMPTSPFTQQPQQQHQLLPTTPQTSPTNSQTSQHSHLTTTTTSQKIRQTILRSEMEGFLLMGCTSLIRKFLTMQGVDCTYTHHPVQALRISVWLTEGFLQSLNTQSHPAVPISPEDLFDFDSLVDLFKQYVYSKAADIRSRTSATEPEAIKNGHRYDLAFHKSLHHLKMENNHALVEDLNLFAKPALEKSVPPTSFYGVFDGHGGYLVSEYLSLHFPNAVARHSLFGTDKLEQVLHECFMSLDASILKKISRDVSH